MENEVRLIDANAFIETIEKIACEDKTPFFHLDEITQEIFDAPTIDPESLRPKGQWELEVKSFYRDTFDESCELAVYILATCSCCGGKHPNSHQVYSKDLYAPEDAEEDYRFDETAEREKALAEFQKRNYVFANYCHNCGADMRGDSE